MALPARFHTHASTLHPPGDAATDTKQSPATMQAPAISVVEVYIDAEKKWCVVDLLKDVGELYEEESPRAHEYKQIGIEWEDGTLLYSFPSFLPRISVYNANYLQNNYPIIQRRKPDSLPLHPPLLPLPNPLPAPPRATTPNPTMA
jgi:hypothetical protein